MLSQLADGTNLMCQVETGSWTPMTFSQDALKASLCEPSRKTVLYNYKTKKGKKKQLTFIKKKKIINCNSVIS